MYSTTTAYTIIDYTEGDTIECDTLAQLRHIVIGLQELNHDYKVQKGKDNEQCEH